MNREFIEIVTKNLTLIAGALEDIQALIKVQSERIDMLEEMIKNK